MATRHEAGMSRGSGGFGRAGSPTGTRRAAGVLAALLGPLVVPAAASAAGRVALVVGNSDYAHIGRLPNPVNDAADVGAALRRLGFEVTVEEDAGLSALTGALRAFTRASAGADVALVFYAGHGMEMDGVNYLLPVDALLERDTDVRFETVTLDDVLASTSGAGLRLVILDACRNNPYLAREMRWTSRTRNVSNGSLGDLNEDLLRGDDETLVAYSAAAGTTADDGEGRNSPYASALLAHLEDPVDIGVMFRRVRARVLSATNERQRPHEYSSLLREHYLGASGGGNLIADPRPRAGEAFRDCDGCPEMVVIPAGTFTMGSPAKEEGRLDSEGPQHRVTVSSFALGRYEVTRSEYAAFVTATDRGSGGGCYGVAGGEWGMHAELSWREPGFAQGGGHPVVCVNWRDAQAYAAWLSEETGESYRLPSESEWEYAARAGTERARYWGTGSDDQCAYANGADAAAKFRFSGWTVAGCDDGTVWTASAGSYDANDFRLFDMLGNVWERVEDCWHENYEGAPRDGAAWASGGNCGRRVLRGGSWAYAPRSLRSAARFRITTGLRYSGAGFRVARTLD